MIPGIMATALIIHPGIAHTGALTGVGEVITDSIILGITHPGMVRHGAGEVDIMDIIHITTIIGIRAITDIIPVLTIQMAGRLQAQATELPVHTIAATECQAIATPALQDVHRL